MRYTFVEPEVKRQQLEEAIEKAIGRKLDALELRKVQWLSECEFETSGVILDLFKEAAQRNE